MAGRFAEAEALGRQALAAAGTVTKRRDVAVAMAQSVLGDILRETGQYVEAEALQKEALQTLEKRYGRDSEFTATALISLGNIYFKQGREAEALPMLEAALRGIARAYGRNSLEAGEIRNSLANVLGNLGQLDRAIAEYEAVVEIGTRAGVKGRSLAATAASNLGNIYNAQKRPGEAIESYRKAYDLNLAEFGADNPAPMLNLMNAAVVYRDNGYPDQAKGMFETVLAFREKNLGPDHPDTALARNNIGWLEINKGDGPAAFVQFQAALSGYERFRARQPRGLRETSTGASFREVSRTVLGILKAVSLIPGGAPPAELDEAFQAAQRAMASTAALSLSRAGARFAAAGGELGDTIREGQDLAGRWQKLEALRMQWIARPAKQRNPKIEQQIASEQEQLRVRLDEIDQTIAARFPEYATLTDPKPLSIATVQSLLTPDEAMLLVVSFGGSNGSGTYSFLVTKDSARLTGSDTPIDDVARLVHTLRCGLDPTAMGEAASRERCGSLGIAPSENGPARFDLAASHELYKLIVGPLGDALKGKRLFVVAPDPIAALPLQVLVTAQPGETESYRTAAWLGRDTPVTVMPSVAALATLRRETAQPEPPSPYIGFGDPVLAGNTACPTPFPPDDRCPDATQTIVASRGATLTRAASAANLAAIFRSNTVDVEAVRALCPLPDSAVEVRCVARSLGAAPEDVHLAEGATVTAVRNAALDRYRVVHFATHGLVAGDIESADGSLIEPALVLTPPAQSSPGDDGLLKASDIIALRLNADLVILSACNTAAGERAGGEALSGLANAFLYAGARSLLASNWPVASDAAVRITTGMTAALAGDPGIGRAEALRRSIVGLMESEEDSHPSYWAPFSLIGEGGAARR